MMKILSLTTLSTALLVGCTSIDLNTVNANKTPEYPHNYENTISNAIKPALKDFNTDVFYKVSEPHKLQYKVTNNIINTQIYDGYGVCYIVSAKDSVGVFDKNKIFLFILDGEKILYSTNETQLNVLENTKIYDTCNKIQKSQNRV